MKNKTPLLDARGVLFFTEPLANVVTDSRLRHSPAVAKPLLRLLL